MYIKAASHIGHFDASDLEAWIKALKPISGDSALAEPDYKERLDPRSLRRMTSILKMGSYNAVDCLAKAGNAIPDSIIVGTGLGCSTDTLSFLNEINTNLEAALSPTAFIRSTHNTVAGQIALLLKNKGYNMTFTQGSLSFESALADAQMAIAAGELNSALVGGIDELSDGLSNLLNDLARMNGVEAPVLGQGSSFFYVSNEGAADDVQVVAVQSFHNGQSEENISSFIEKAGVTPDLILDGSGWPVAERSRSEKQGFNYKAFCGEYFSASAFGTMLGYAILKTGLLPAGVEGNSPKTILVNSGFGKEQGLVLLRIQ